MRENKKREDPLTRTNHQPSSPPLLCAGCCGASLNIIPRDRFGMHRTRTKNIIMGLQRQQQSTTLTKNEIQLNLNNKINSLLID